MYDKKVLKYKGKQNKILNEMQAHSDAEQDFYLTANKVFNLAKRASEIFESSEPIGKRQLLNFLLQNCTLSGLNLHFKLKEPFNLIVETRHQPIGLRIVDDVRTIFEEQSEYIYIPDLRPQGQI